MADNKKYSKDSLVWAKVRGCNNNINILIKIRGGQEL